MAQDGEYYTRHLLRIGVAAFLLPIAFVLPLREPLPFAWVVIVAVVLLGLSLWVGLMPIIVVARQPSRVFKGNIENHLVFAMFGVLSFVMCALVVKTWPGEQGPAFIVLAPWALVSMAWMSLSCWVFVFHGIGLFLAVGRRLPVFRRMLFYYVVVLAPTTPVVVFVWHRGDHGSPLFWTPVLLVIIGLLGYLDFSRYPPLPRDSRYDRIAKHIARFLGGVG
jgi:hypothetical protein